LGSAKKYGSAEAQKNEIKNLEKSDSLKAPLGVWGKISKI